MCEKINKNHIVSDVEPGSYGAMAGIVPGDQLLKINDEPIEDIFDYRFNSMEDSLSITYLRDGQEHTVTIQKNEYDDLGLYFENGLMDEYRRCKNNCIFCFIDQMPKGMRETLYFKDDDSRLSFLQGNYITLTNLSHNDIERIIKFRMEPINISFQTTNPELRVKMLNNRFAGEALKIADRFFEEEITMNGQIVLCKGVNDKEELQRTIRDLAEYLPVLESVSIVPVGLTKYRDGLYPLTPFTKEDAISIIDMVEEFQKKCYELHGLHFVHCSDEFYILAEREVPLEETYDGYLQLENGVGMLRLLIDEFDRAYEELHMSFIQKKLMKKSEATIITGKLAYPYIKKFADRVNNDFPNVSIDVLAIRNDFFGESITVSGLITAGDIIKQCKENGYKKRLLIPQNMLRADEEVFLDDVSLSTLCETLQVNVDIVKSSGRDLLQKMLKDGV